MINRDSKSQPTKPPDFLESDKESSTQLLSEKYKKEYSSSLLLNYFSASYKIFMYLGIVALVAWLAYQQGRVDGRNEDNLVRIAPDNEATTIVPDDPGGLKIPNQDLKIYDSGQNSDASKENQITQTVPKPDQPIMRAEPKTEISQSEINQIMEDLSDSKKNIQPSEEPKPEEEVDTTAADDEGISPQSEDFVANIAKDLRNQNLNDAGPYRVQLASLTSKILAENELSKIKEKLSNILNNFELKIYPVDIEDRGIYYRVQAGPIKTSDEAKNLCNELIRLQEKCFVVNLGQVE